MSLAGFSARSIIIRKFSEKSPLFVEYSYLVYPFAFFLLLYMWLESFGWSFKKAVISNSLRETGPRILFTILLLFFAVHFIQLRSFLLVFSLSFLPPAFILYLVVKQTKEFLFIPRISVVTTRMKGKMLNFGMFLFGAQFLNLLSKTSDTFILTATSKRGLIDTAVFTIATYVVTLMEIPQRSINAVSIPVLVDAWKNKNLDSIRNIYTKSVANLLIIGLAMFCLILLNVQNLAIFLGKGYTGIEKVVFFLGIGKLIDLGTGANTQIISTSNYWKVDFTTNVIYTLVSLPLNYILISHFDLLGASYATMIAIAFYNAMRFGFLWYKFGLQPYTFKDLLALVYAAISAIAAYLIPKSANIFADTAVRTLVFCTLFFPAVYFTGISAEINQLIKKYLSWVRNIIFRR